MDEHINPALRQRLEDRKREQRESMPGARRRHDPDAFKPASMQPGSDKLALFWIVYFVVFGGLSWYFGSGAS